MPAMELYSGNAHSRGVVQLLDSRSQMDADVDLLVIDWLSEKSEATRRAYAGDLRRFGEWLDIEDPREVCGVLLEAGPAGARHLVLQFRLEMERRHLSAATINRSLAALRSLIDLGRDSGLIDWSLRVKGVQAQSYRDTSGPERGVVEAILEAARTQVDDRVARRDLALLRLLYGLALRRSEAVSLDIEHLDLDRAVVWILGKGKRQRTPLSLPACLIGSLRTWVLIHPAPSRSAPLFIALDRSSRSRLQRLSCRSVARILARACEVAGVREYSPHALRHSAITTALDRTGGDHRAVRSFSRHASIQTVVTYDDHRKDGFGAVARRVAL